MKNRILLLIAAAVMIMACGNHVSDVEIIPIQDNPTPRLMARALFSEASDSLFDALGLQNGIPSFQGYHSHFAKKRPQVEAAMNRYGARFERSGAVDI